MSENALRPIRNPVLGELWAGRIFGTNTGRIFLEINDDGERLSGNLRLSDDNTGLVSLSVTGTFENGILNLEGTPIDLPEGVQLGKVTATARLQPKGELSGECPSVAFRAVLDNLNDRWRSSICNIRLTSR